LILKAYKFVFKFCTYTAGTVHGRKIFEMDQIYRARPQATVSIDEESNLK